jgi:hypothetical protein
MECGFHTLYVLHTHDGCFPNTYNNEGDLEELVHNVVPEHILGGAGVVEAGLIH